MIRHWIAAHITNPKPYRLPRVNFVTYRDLTAWSLEWAKQLPHDFDCIVGIPREGMLPATTISLWHGKPLSTPLELMLGHSWLSSAIHKSPIRRVLLIDDSIGTGETMAGAARLLSGQYEVKTAALIVSSASVKPNFWYKCVDEPRMLEWHMVHRHLPFRRVAMDMDGVICRDCPAPFDTNETWYRAWLESVEPLMIPTYRVACVVSNRLEKFRPETEAWLKRYGVQYDQLCLWDLASKVERDRHDLTEHKIAMLRSDHIEVMYESDPTQARAIWKATGVPVICPTTGECFSGGQMK